MTADPDNNNELDALLMDRFAINRTTFVAALKSIPPSRPWAVRLPEEDARLLDAADFPEDPSAALAAELQTAGGIGRLVNTAFTVAQVAQGLGITPARVRQKRLARELWGIANGQSWVFPVLQFDTDENGGPIQPVRGLEQVFKVLPADLHPAAVAGFLFTQQPELYAEGRQMSPLEWLRSGGDITAVVAAADAAYRYSQ
ncbi:hypothetical protein [Mycobacteroides abscessus]|uniref:hypothetical protein n=1 Tax=Mycobacteroides abscessus TaxID=36809 RepID=UPI000929722E|nr:hypothetical protein [Mycobacteroides abscessus]SHQ47274.1 Uncharacterised protein [Mycobacteroides abscessus subsp. abscessus]SKQ86181.1 Uncharacterised protein [Mycobacteroides abscessus subsp. massiliense]SLC48329.1 Uncharacterised protein [Mycobacteroides abscessus subsp. massiliense]